MHTITPRSERGDAEGAIANGAAGYLTNGADAREVTPFGLGGGSHRGDVRLRVRRVSRPPDEENGGRERGGQTS